MFLVFNNSWYLLLECICNSEFSVRIFLYTMVNENGILLLHIVSVWFPLLVIFFLMICTVSSQEYHEYPEYTDLDEQATYFIPRPNNVTSLRGETAKLQCSIENLGSKFVVWRKASDPHPISVGTFIYSPDKRFNVSFSPTRREFNLIIEDVQSSDEGVYECQVSSKNKLIRHILLTVNKTNLSESSKLRSLQNINPHNPDILLEGKEFINSGEILRLMCNVSGVQEMSQDLDWFKDGNLLKPSHYKRISIEKQSSFANRMLTSVLEIEKSSTIDTGTYVCRNSDLIIASKKVIVLSEEKSNPDKRGAAGETKNCQISHGEFWTMCLLTIVISVVVK